MGDLTSIFLCGLVGALMYIALLLFNPYPAVLGKIVPMVDTITYKLHSQLLSNPLITTMLGGISSAGIVNAIKSKIQSHKDAAAQQIQSNMEQTVMGKVNEIQKLQQQNQQLTSKLTDQDTLKTQLDQLQVTASRKDVQISQLQTEKKELERVLAKKNVIVEQAGVVH